MISFLPALILFLVLGAIFFKAWIPFKIAPWLAMSSGAIAVLVLGQISFGDALAAIDLDTMIFLYATFVLSGILQESGYLLHLGYKFMRHFYHPFLVLVSFSFCAGVASAFLLNDTVAIIGVPLCITMAKKSGVPVAPLLVALALGVTIGGMPSPIGSPHNYIIATKGNVVSPFFEFAKYLLVPTVLSLVALAGILWLMFPDLRRLRRFTSDHWKREKDYGAARRCFQVVVLLSMLRLASGFVPGIPNFALYLIPVAGAAVAVFLSGRPRKAFATEWETLGFFAAMFILMAAVWQSGFFQQFLPPQSALSEPIVVVLSSLILSQFLSNVPLAIIYLNAFSGNMPIVSLMWLVAGSTLAGGLTIIGAASNIIIMQTAERSGEKFPMKEFTIAGVASIAVSLVFIWAWMALIG